MGRVLDMAREINEPRKLTPELIREAMMEFHGINEICMVSDFALYKGFKLICRAQVTGTGSVVVEFRGIAGMSKALFRSAGSFERRLAREMAEHI